MLVGVSATNFSVSVGTVVVATVVASSRSLFLCCPPVVRYMWCYFEFVAFETVDDAPHGLSLKHCRCLRLILLMFLGVLLVIFLGLVRVLCFAWLGVLLRW